VEKIKVGIINSPPTESGYRDANVRDFENVFSEENGYEAKTFYSINNGMQIKAAQQFIDDGVGYLMICAAMTIGWEGVLESAKKAGVKVFLFDRMIDVDDDLYDAAVVSDTYKQGENAVKLLEGLRLPEYKVVHIQGPTGSNPQVGRSSPLVETIAKKSNWSIVAQESAAWDEGTARSIVEDVIDSGEEFNVIYAENDGMAAGAVTALDRAGISHGVDGDVVIVGFDCNKWALGELLRGRWNFDIQASPFQAAEIDRMIKNGVVQKLVVPLEKGFDARTITQEDVIEYGI
jgi:simple sugar transport system substrate-binding protein